MNSTTSQPPRQLDIRQLAQAGMAALRSGRPAEARAAFEKVAGTGLGDASLHLALAIACEACQDRGAALSAVDTALRLEPKAFRALVFKADLLEKQGDRRGASAFYSAANQVLPTEGLPPDLKAEAARVREICRRMAGDFEDILRNALQGEGELSPRMAQSLDLLAGKRERYIQEPRYYFLPELPCIQFFPRGDFPWLDDLERETAVIRSEAAALLADATIFEPYVKAEANRPHRDQQGMVDNPAWTAFYLWKDGVAIPGNQARCPRTTEAISRLPLCKVPGRSPSVLFSRLLPGAHIPAHTGMVNTRLIVHLPLIVPGPAQLRVGNETRAWEEGRAWVFDDTIEHEAWNRAAADRVILLFEIWRPELTDAERRQVVAMFRAIDGAGGGAAWDM